MSQMTTFKDVLWTVGRRLGFDPAGDAAWSTEKVFLTDMVNKAYRMAWEHWPWRQLMTITEETPTTHGSVTGAMYVVRENSTRTLDYVESVWSADPRATGNAVNVPYRQESDGLYFYSGHPSTVWVRFRDEAPEFTSTDWVTATAYVIGDLVYVSTTGQVYKCLEAHTSGALATDLAADKWVAVEVWKFLKQPVIEGVLAFRAADEKRAGTRRLMMAETVRDELEQELKIQRQLMK